MNKILSITKQEPREVTLPDGGYLGVWSSNVITLQHEGNTYELKTEHGVRGIGIKVVVTISNGVATFTTLKN